MSDSEEDDFMSDKFLLDLPSTTSTGSRSSSNNHKIQSQSYTEKRHAQALKSMRKGQANNKIPLKLLEEQRRREGLNTSLFDQHLAAAPGSGSDSSGGQATGSVAKNGLTGTGARAGTNKAMGMMMKMGWKAGEGLGKKRSPSPEIPSKRAKLDSASDSHDNGNLNHHPRGGIDSSSASASEPSASPIFSEGNTSKGNTNANTKASGGRIEPIRISMWSGRKGLGASAREPSPPPLPPSTSNRDPDALDPRKLERLGRETEGFRERQRNEWTVKERERKGTAAREKLVALNGESGIKFHPLHILPFDPLSTLPKPLLRLIYPSQAFSPSPSAGPEPGHAAEPIVAYKDRSNLSAAEKMREQMRRDMLSDLHGDDIDDDDEEGVVRFGILPDDSSVKREIKDVKATEGENDLSGVKWEEMISGAKRVLAMDPETYLNFVVDQLRHEYLFCFWCAYRYKSYEEMEGFGGCPGEEEDDH
ncbi:hypothetical protein IAU59_002013 [Kwoniella sp. CBS 9459]